MCFSLALASLNKHTEAATYYKKALELDPDNDTYKTNLKIAEEKMETLSPVRGDEETGNELVSADGGMTSSFSVCFRRRGWAESTWLACSVTPAS